MDEDTNERNRDDINAVLNLAKLHEDDMLPVAQTLHFTSHNLHTNPYKLLQLNPQLMKELVDEGQTLYIKGDDDDNVVLCSDKHTYNVQEVETSNSLLLVDHLKMSDEISNNPQTIHKLTISSVFYEYLEATITKPNLRKLTEILSKSSYKGPEHEFKINPNDLKTYDDLNDIIQASNHELQSAFKSLTVATIDGKIRLLDFEYHFRVLSYMLNLIDENSWALDEIDYEETMNALNDLVPCREILDSLFDKYAEETRIVDGLQLYQYRETDVCRFFAQVLLYSAGRFNLDEFLQAWRESVPEGMVTDEDVLYGVAVIDRNANPNVIWAFTEDQLPDNVYERFDVLFATKEKWRQVEIAPYIQRLTTDKADVSALLAKYTRVSHMDGVKYYSAKHAK